MLSTDHPYVYYPPHSTALMLHEALTYHGLAEDHIFHQYIKAALTFMRYLAERKHEAPVWPPVVKSFCQTLQNLGQQATFDFLRGPGPTSKSGPCPDAWNFFNLPLPPTRSVRKYNSFLPVVKHAGTQRCLLSLFHHLMRHYETKSLFNTAAVTIFPAHLTATNLYKTLLFVPCPCSPQNCEGHFERSTVRLGRFLKRPCYVCRGLVFAYH